MRRLLTLVLALGLSVLIAAAAVDALRGLGELRRPAEDRGASRNDTAQDAETPDVEIDVRASADPASWIGDRDVLAGRLRRNRVRGTLYLSADNCLQGNPRHLRALHLSDLRLSEGPRTRSCSFTASADGDDTAGPDAAWSPQVPVFSAEIGADEIAVIDVKHSRQVELAGSAPAFKPDGTFTQVAEGGVVAWTNDCAHAPEFISPPISFGPGQLGPYCTSTAVARSELLQALPSGDRLRSVDALVWLDAARALAVLNTAAGSWLAAFEQGRSLGDSNGPISRNTQAPRADPTGRYVALSAGGYLEVYDRDAELVWGSGIQATSFDWSPDGAWLAYAATGNVFLVRTSDWTTRFSLPVSTEGLAWR